MTNKLRKIKNRDEEKDFWASHDSTKYVDWKKGEEGCASQA
jgi:hypothetical protein